MGLKARVQKDRLVLDEPTDLPEGTEIDLVPLDPGDWLDDDDREALHRALDASEADVAAGRLVDADDVLKEDRRAGLKPAPTDSGKWWRRIASGEPRLC